MKISAMLRTTQRLYIETAPLIYYVEVNPAYIARMDAIITAVENGTIEAYSSVLTLTEVLVHPLREGNDVLKRRYRSVLINNQDLRLLPITTPIAEAAADLRARYNLRTPDALHIAAAIDSRCDVFLTNDVDIRRVTEITVLVLDELEPDLPDHEET
jgi:predicted nucleic acid-binding protein